MKKKIIPLFLAAAVSVSGVLPIGAVQPVTVMAENGHPARLVDNAGLLDEDEALELESKLDEISQEYDCDVVILTEETINGAEPMDYADDYFDYEGYGMGEDNSGILFSYPDSFRLPACTDHNQTDKTPPVFPDNIRPSSHWNSPSKA